MIGDKTAHTATLHLPQMLYIWPYIAFFSAPLLIVPLLRLGLSLMPRSSRKAISAQSSVSPQVSFSNLLSTGLCFVAAATIIVHFNTIIHPYTLADNRHYVFYVFRVLRRHPAIRYAAVPVYYSCAWLTMRALAVSSNEQHQTDSKRNGQSTHDNLHRSPCKISFILIWLVTTALSVITAPLVEPRYFILPWVIWRLHVPSDASLSSAVKISWRIETFRLILETAWLWVIDFVVTYIFIRWTFEWPNEPGKVQRFLW